MKYTLVKFTFAPVYMSCYNWLPIQVTPVYRGDFMFLYRFVRRRRRRRRRRPQPAAASCPRDNFWTTFWISFIFGTIVGPDL